MGALDGVDPAGLRERLADRSAHRDTLMLVAALAYLDGVSVSRISDRYGVPQSTVYRWFDELEADETADDRGRPPKLDESERERLCRLLSEPPSAAGVDAERWSASAVRELLAARFDVDYSRTQAWRLRESCRGREGADGLQQF